MGILIHIGLIAVLAVLVLLLAGWVGFAAAIWYFYRLEGRRNSTDFDKNEWKEL